MKEIMIKTIKEDITYMLTELGNMRKIEVNKDIKNKLMENSGLSQDSVGYRVYFKDLDHIEKWLIHYQNYMIVLISFINITS